MSYGNWKTPKIEKNETLLDHLPYVYQYVCMTRKTRAFDNN